MTQKAPPNPEELILAMLRDVLARQAEAMGLKSETNGKQTPEPKAPPPTIPPATREALAEVLRAPSAPAPSIPSTPAPPRPLPAAPPPKPVIEPPPPKARPATRETAEGEEPLTESEKAELAEYEALAAEPLAPNGFTRAVRWSLVAILIVIVLASLPLFEGQSLFRVQSEVQNIVLRDGLLLKGSSDAVYVIEGGARRLITSVEAFEHYHYRWTSVTEVTDDFLRALPEGRPVNVLLTCEGIPDIYLLAGPEKRIVRDLEALTAEGYALERDLRTIPCNRLRSISDGLPFP